MGKEEAKMRINIDAVKELIAEKFRNNKTFFADTIFVDPGYLISILNGHRSNDSSKVIRGIIKYCKQNNIDYKKYIFLP